MNFPSNSFSLLMLSSLSKNKYISLFLRAGNWISLRRTPSSSYLDAASSQKSTTAETISSLGW